MAESVDITETDVMKKLSSIIENGILVDRTLRVPSSYSYLMITELKAEVFSVIVDLLYNKEIPLWLSQKAAWFFINKEYHLSLFEDLIEVKSKDEYQYPDFIDNSIGDLKVISREKLVSHLRSSISKILSSWLNNDENFLKQRQDETKTVLEYNSFGIKNKRRSMEDRTALYDDLNIFFNQDSIFRSKPHALFAIFDGHCGIEAAHYVSYHLPFNIIFHELYETDIEKAIYDSFEKTNKRLSSKATAESFRSGTTGTISIIRDDKLYIAWCGDSQVCLIKHDKPYFMNDAHKPNNEKERERIEKLGGQVIFSSKDWRVNGVLSVARAFGDIDYQPFITSDPDYLEFDLKSLDLQYLILGCDGLWENANTDENLNQTCETIKGAIEEKKESGTISEILVNKAKETGSGDNISAIFVFLKRMKEKRLLL